MRVFVCFSAAIVWGLVVAGAGAWALVLIDPSGPVSLGKMAATIGVLAVMAVLFVGGCVVAEHVLNAPRRHYRSHQ